MGNIILMCTGDIRQFRLKERKVSSRKRLGEGAFRYPLQMRALGVWRQRGKRRGVALRRERD